MRFAVMIEGQEDVSWADWLAIAADCERLGFHALFRSDHYLSVDGVSGRGSLDAWTTLGGLAAATSELRLGTLVSPATFRHPSVLAKAVVTADHISGGRIELGIGTGWLEAEHVAYGFPFPPLRERMDRLAEQLEIIRRSWADERFSFTGEHWTIADLDARPKPVAQPHPPLLMGGGAGPRGAALAARWASEYNVVHVDPASAAAARSRLDAACDAIDRDPASLGFSLMQAFLIGSDAASVRARTRRMAAWHAEPDLDAWIAGTPDQVIERLGRYAAAGVERVMLQHHLYRDSEALELFAAEVAPAFAA